jgi:hypothetical protein
LVSARRTKFCAISKGIQRFGGARMSKILPAGQHNGTILRSWSSSRLFVCHIAYRAEAAYDEHANERASLIIVERGHCSKRMGRQTFDLSQHSLFFIPSQYTQADFFPVATSFFAAEFSASFLERFHEAYSRTMEPVELTPQDDQDFRGRLLRELVEPDAVSELVFEGVLLNMLACARRGRKGRNGSPPSWLLRAKELLHDRAFESLKLYEIAKAVDVHPVCTLFQGHTGGIFTPTANRICGKAIGRDQHGVGSNRGSKWLRRSGTFFESVPSTNEMLPWSVQKSTKSPGLTPGSYGRGGVGRSCRIIQLMPNRSWTCPKRKAKNVSCIGIKTRPLSESAVKTRSASLSLSILSVR